jgi:hypothetical protein
MVEERLMAGISGSPDVAMASVADDRDSRTQVRGGGLFAWLSIGIAVWITGGFFLLVWAVGHGQGVPDVLLSIYAMPFYLGIVVLSVVFIALAIQASRQGRGWRAAVPAGYGVLGAGAIALIGGLIADVGWREGVGNPDGIASLISPTRLLLVAGLALIAAGPFRSRLRSERMSAPPWPAVLSACLVLVALSSPGGFHPAVSPWMERAPFTANAEIWLMNGDGSHQTRLIEAHDGVMAWNPIWSPDGKRLAYTRLVQGDRPPVDIPDEADIWVADADGGHAHALVTRPDWQWLPHWSPDGIWIVYTDEPEGGPWASTGPAGLGGGGLFGTGIFAASNPVRSYADIWRVRADGTGSPERLTELPGDDRAAAFSPDGTKLAFDSTRAGGTDVFVMNADGSGVRQLTFDHASTWGATWSPDGSRIAFNAWRAGGGNEDIYVVAPDGNGEKRLTTDPADDIEPSWSPDGGRIVFRRIHGPPDGGRILSIATDGSDEQELSRDAGAGFDLTSGGGVWAPDGRIAIDRGSSPAADASPLVREDLATASVLITAILLAFMAVQLARIRPPFGAFTFLNVVPAAIFGMVFDRPQFIPAAFVGGLIVDVLVRFAPGRWKGAVAGAGSAAALIVGAELTVAVTSGLGWSISLLTGVVVAAAAIGWCLGVMIGSPRTPDVASS